MPIMSHSFGASGQEMPGKERLSFVQIAAQGPKRMERPPDLVIYATAGRNPRDREKAMDPIGVSD